MIKLKTLLREMEGYGAEMEFRDMVKRLEADLKDKYPQLEDLSVFVRSGGDIYIDSIRVAKNDRGKGIGGAVIRAILDFADKHGRYVTLHASPEPRYKAKLKKFYKNLGFIPNSGRKTIYQFSNPFYQTMFRRPEKIVEGARLDRLNSMIDKLHQEWDNLDSTGVGYSRQREIGQELMALMAEKGRWERFHAAVDNAVSVSENELVMEARATPKMLESFLREMIKGSEWEGKVFLVGGFVRDELMGKEPKDADVVVGKNQGGVEFTIWLAHKLGIYKGPASFPPQPSVHDTDQFMLWLERMRELYASMSNPVVFPTFGTANLRLDGVVWNGIDFTGESVDAVMFRKEQYHDPNSRRPTVQFTQDMATDASRRDLTFNALYKDIASGRVIDPTGKGIPDLKAGIIRTPSDPTLIYTDDALRMFRAVRFAAKLGFEIAPEVIDGIKKNLHRLGNTSKERIRDELNKILTSGNPELGMRLLRDTGLLPYVGKELQQLSGLTQNIHHKHDAFDHTMEVLKATQPELVRRLMALFHDIGKVVTRSETPSGVHFYGHEDAGPEIAEKIMRDLKYPLDLINAVKMGVRNHMRLKQGGDEAILTDKTLRKFKIELGEYLEQILDVIHADNISHADASAMPNQIERVRARLKALDVQVKKPNLPVTGKDLLALGFPQGPFIGKALGAITDAWFENPAITRDEALAIAQKMKPQ